MALSPGLFVLRMHTTTGKCRTFVQMPAYLQETLLHGVPIWEADEASLKGQGRRQKDLENCFTARTNRLRGPIGV